jgi:hypothetical protein
MTPPLTDVFLKLTLKNMQFSSVLLTLVASLCILNSTFALPTPSAVSDAQLASGHVRLEKRVLPLTTNPYPFLYPRGNTPSLRPPKSAKIILTGDFPIQGEEGRMMSEGLDQELTEPFFLEHYIQPPTNLPLNVMDQLEVDGVDFLYVKLTREMSKLMVEKNYEGVNSLLSASLPAKDFFVARRQVFHLSTIDPDSDLLPISAFHLDGTDYPDGIDGNILMLNFWIPTMDVKGRPLAFVKSSSLSPSQNNDKENEFIFVPDMKGPSLDEPGEMLVFRSSHVYHGSPILEDLAHQGERDVMAFAFNVNRMCNGVRCA